MMFIDTFPETGIEKITLFFFILRRSWDLGSFKIQKYIWSFAYSFTLFLHIVILKTARVCYSMITTSTMTREAEQNSLSLSLSLDFLMVQDLNQLYMLLLFPTVPINQ